MQILRSHHSMRLELLQIVSTRIRFQWLAPLCGEAGYIQAIDCSRAAHIRAPLVTRGGRESHMMRQQTIDFACAAPLSHRRQNRRISPAMSRVLR